MPVRHPLMHHPWILVAQLILSSCKINKDCMVAPLHLMTMEPMNMDTKEITQETSTNLPEEEEEVEEAVILEEKEVVENAPLLRTSCKLKVTIRC